MVKSFPKTVQLLFALGIALVMGSLTGVARAKKGAKGTLGPQAGPKRAGAREHRVMRAELEALRRQLALRRLGRDKRLDAAALANSLALSELDGAMPKGARAFLRFQLFRHRVTDAVVQAIALRYFGLSGQLPKKQRAELATFLKRHLSGGRLSRIGVGIALARTGEQVATVVLTRRLARVRYNTARVCVRVFLGRRPRLLFTTPGGRVFQRNARSRRFCAKLPGAHAGRYQVELMVDTRFGSEVAALFPIYRHVDAPRRPTVRLYPKDDSDLLHAESLLFDLINKTRVKAGLLRLKASTRLTRVARSHSKDMLKNHFFGHRSPTRGSLTHRLSYQGLRNLYALENLAISTSVRRAHDSLLASPSHRRVMLDPRLTRLGVGITREVGSGLLHITECFARL
jgi:uncharacterized protein YkwD